MIKSIMTKNVYGGGVKTIGKKAPEYRPLVKLWVIVDFTFVYLIFLIMMYIGLSLKILVLKHFKILIFHDLTAQWGFK